MEDWKRDARKEAVVTELEALAPIAYEMISTVSFAASCRGIKLSI